VVLTAIQSNFPTRVPLIPFTGRKIVLPGCFDTIPMTMGTPNWGIRATLKAKHVALFGMTNNDFTMVKTDTLEKIGTVH
jgi:hypothetical protein